MSTNILAFLIEPLFFVLISAALLRAYMNWQRMPMQGQPAKFVMAVSDCVVKPLRRVMPKAFSKLRLDMGSVLAGLLFALLHTVLVLAIAGAWSMFSVDGIPDMFVRSLKMLLRVGVQATMLMVFGYALMSWTQTASSALHTWTRLVDPLLLPFRRVLPLVGGVDLSALVVLVLLQMAMVFFV